MSSNHLNFAVLTVSDTRTEETDTSGQYLVESIASLGHSCQAKAILPDEPAQVRAQVAQWVAEGIHLVVTTGGTGFAGRDSTPEAVRPLFDKDVEGFGELFRALSVETIRSSTVQSRAFAGFSFGTLIFCLPGSKSACTLAFEKILVEQLDAAHKPCNFVNLLVRGDARRQ